MPCTLLVPDLIPTLTDRAVLEAVFRLGILRGIELLYRVDGQQGAGISRRGKRHSEEKPASARTNSGNAFHSQEVVPITPAVGARRACAGSR